MQRFIRPANRILFSLSHRAVTNKLPIRPLGSLPHFIATNYQPQSQFFHVWNRHNRDAPAKGTPSNETISETTEEQVDPKHQMLIGFTCKVCNERSHHVMSKLSYTKGVVLIECPGCQNRHLIADNLGWFRDGKTTVEDLVKEKGEGIRKVIVAEDGSEHGGNLMEWLPDIVADEKDKKERAKAEADKLKQEE
ncbi:DNL zinc finger-domain-containing protein [Umbelopsis sp. PMI_123]|nr:DNL zinc finger-domain-containing protein [Umbelopsis sp. PMI_123]